MTPPPPLAPPALHFLILDFTITCGTMEFTFECTTDTAVRLTLHLSTDPPIIRRIPYIKRGADFEMSSVTCFVVTDTYVQNEAGDTFTHTFTVPIAGYGLPYYWYLTGTHGGVPSHSMSQIFNVTCSKPTTPTERCKAQPPFNGGHSAYRCTFMSSCFEPLTSYNITSCDVTFKTDATQSRICYDGQFELWTAAANGRPSVRLQTHYFTNPCHSPNTYVTVNVPLTPALLAGGSHYAIVWGWRDYHVRRRYLKAQWPHNLNLNCEYTIPPSKHIWYRIFNANARQRCTTLATNWTAYVYDRNLTFKTFGQDP